MDPVKLFQQNLCLEPWSSWKNASKRINLRDPDKHKIDLSWLGNWTVGPKTIAIHHPECQKLENNSPIYAKRIVYRLWIELSLGVFHGLHYPYHFHIRISILVMMRWWLCFKNEMKYHMLLICHILDSPGIHAGWVSYLPGPRGLSYSQDSMLCLAPETPLKRNATRTKHFCDGHKSLDSSVCVCVPFPPL